MVSLSAAVIQSVREKLGEALNSPSTPRLHSYLLTWLGIERELTDWKKPTGILQLQDVLDAAGYYAATGSEDAAGYLLTGIPWLSQRRFFLPGQPSLESDPVGCVCLAAAIYRLPDHAGTEWIEDLVKKAISAEGESWRKSVYNLALCIVAGVLPDVKSPVYRVAVAQALGHDVTQDDLRGALRVVVSTEIHEEQAPFYAAALHRVFETSANIDLLRPSVEQVVSVLRNLQPSLKRWTWETQSRKRSLNPERWNITNEYHVQALVWLALRPIFPDLEDEESLPSFGPKHPRADILIPSLKLIVEIKFLREATQSARAKVIEEVAADSALYRGESKYDKIIPLIWDQTQATQHHGELLSGLVKLEGIVDAVFLTRPGDWR